MAITILRRTARLAFEADVPGFGRWQSSVEYDPASPPTAVGEMALCEASVAQFVAQREATVAAAQREEQAKASRDVDDTTALSLADEEWDV